MIWKIQGYECIPGRKGLLDDMSYFLASGPVLETGAHFILVINVKYLLEGKISIFQRKSLKNVF
jgi:hypothetical protein